MSDANKPDDDSLAYEKAQQGGMQTDDPLAAIKDLRLEQLAACKLRSEKEMLAMREKLKTEDDAD